MILSRLLPALLASIVLVPAAQARTCLIGAPGTQRVEIGTTGRSTLVHFPKGRSGPLPLLFLLHGSGSKGEEMLRSSKLAETAEQHGFVVAAPDAGIPHDKGFVWNIPGVPTVTGKVPSAADADDVAFLTDAIEWLVEQGCVDPARVYATGLSGGGRMTSWLGCVAADRFAAIAPVVGLRAGNPAPGGLRVPDSTTCRPTRPMPVIAFAGDADTTNPIQGGGAGYWRYTMHAAQARWADLNLCRTGPIRRDLGARLYEDRYTNCRGGADVVGRITRGGGHSWVADNEAMWAFLSRYRRR